MNERGKSDSLVVPANPPDKAAAAEAGEERGLAKGNTDSQHAPDTGPGQACPRAGSCAPGSTKG